MKLTEETLAPILTHLKKNDFKFYQEYGGPIQLPSELDKYCVVWFDRPDLPPVESQYQELAKLVQNSMEYEHLVLPIYCISHAIPRPVQMFVHAVRKRPND